MGLLQLLHMDLSREFSWLQKEMRRTLEFSIIIPTFNRATSLARLLVSLRAVEGLDRLQTEILVINNASTDNTIEVVRAEQGSTRPYELKVFNEAQKGKANAINRALTAVRGLYIMILDDDVVVDPKVVKSHWECYQETRFAAVQGRILPGHDPDGGPADLTKLREYNIPVIDYGEQCREIRGMTGTNMSFAYDVFKNVGFFDARLGPGASGFSEDTEYSIRIRKAGYKIGYTPHAVVYHELNPERFGRAYNRRTEFLKGQSRSIYRHDSIVFNVVPNLIANCFRFGLYNLLGNRKKVFKTEGRIMKCFGYLAGKSKRRNPTGAASRNR